MQGFDNGDGNGISQNGILESGEVDYTTTYCSSFINRMVGPVMAMDITVMGTRLFFEGYSTASSRELWVHETINGSTWQVADTNSGSGDGYANSITVLDSRLYFEANDGNNGYELWMMEIKHTITYF